MAGLNENLARRVAPDETDKAMSARTRASIAKTFETMAEVGEGVLGDLIAGGGARSEPPIDDLGILQSVAASDPDLASAMAVNEAQWRNYLVMIPSMNVARPEVRAILSSRLTDVYAEGYDLTGRYYTGTGPASVVEDLACERAKAVFNAGYANVQALSGAPANVAAYMALLEAGISEFTVDREGNLEPTPNYEAAPADKVIALGLSDGGHLTHGLFLNFSARFFDFRHYGVDDEGFVDYDQMEAMALEMQPRMVMVGASAYPRDYDYDRVRAICDKLDKPALLMVDMAHYAGLVAAGLMKNPLDHGADIVNFTTHKTLGGPRGAIILTNDEAIHNKVRTAVFPGLQGGAHFNNIAAIALAAYLMEGGLRLCSGGTDNHLILADLRGQGFTFSPTDKELNGRQASECLERAGLIINRNGVPRDTRKPWITSGIRMGTNILAARGMGPEEMKDVAGFILRVLQNAGDEAVEDEVRAGVLDLTSRFPLE
jgi:glycine hydroxymethyltransferase